MNKPLRFCMVTTFYPPYHFGGDGMFVYRLSNELAQRGHHVDVIHSIDSYLLKSGKLRWEYPNHPNVNVHGLKSKTGFLSLLLSQQLGFPVLKAREVKKIIEDGKFDVIHFHNVSLMGGPKVLEYGNAIKLYTTHEYWLVCPTHVLFKFNREACVETSCLKCQIINKRPPQLWRYTDMLDRALKHIDAIISPSRFTADTHRNMGIQIPIEYIPMFVPRPSQPLSNTEGSNRFANPERPYFLFVGRLEKLKGVQNLIPIFSQYSHTDLLIAGDGEFRKRLQEIASENPRVKFLGNLSYEDLKGLYAGAIALLVPSLCYETFGQTIVEAFTMKTPVIVKNIGALPELVTESGGGFLYQKESELTDIMEKLRTNPDLRNELGERGFQTYSRCWTEERHLEEYFKLISGIEKRRRMIA